METVFDLGMDFVSLSSFGTCCISALAVNKYESFVKRKVSLLNYIVALS